MPLLSVAAQHILNITHTVGVCCGAILSADRIVAAVTPTVCKMTYTVSSRTFNDTQTNKQSGLVADTVAMFGIEFIIVFTALLLKKRIAVFHSDITQLLAVSR